MAYLIDRLFQIIGGVIFRHFQELFANALPRRNHGYVLLIARTEKVLDEFAFAVVVRNDLVGDLVRGVVLRNKGRKRLRVGGSIFHGERARALHDAAARDENIDGGVHLVGRESDDVRVEVAVERGDPLQFDLGEHIEFFAAV